MMRKRNSLPFPRQVSRPNRAALSREPIFAPVFQENQCVKRPRMGFKFASFPNIGLRSREGSLKSQNFSQQPPNFSVHSEKNNCNFNDHFIQHKGYAQAHGVQHLSSIFDCDHFEKAGDQAEKRGPVNQHSWKFIKRHAGSPNQKMAFFEDNSLLNSKGNCPARKHLSGEKVIGDRAKPEQISVKNPFLLHKLPALLPPDESSPLEKRAQLKWDSNAEKEFPKARNTNLIIPKTKKVFLSQISISEKDSKCQVHFPNEESMFADKSQASKWNSMRPRKSFPQLLSCKSPQNESTVPDNFVHKRQALEILKKINFLNNKVECNDDFRDKIIQLIASVDQAL